MFCYKECIIIWNIEALSKTVYKICRRLNVFTPTGTDRIGNNTDSTNVRLQLLKIFPKLSILVNMNIVIEYLIKITNNI